MLTWKQLADLGRARQRANEDDLSNMVPPL
jgi:hypothetical protein